MDSYYFSRLFTGRERESGFQIIGTVWTQRIRLVTQTKPTVATKLTTVVPVRNTLQGDQLSPLPATVPILVGLKEVCSSKWTE